MKHSRLIPNIYRAGITINGGSQAEEDEEGGPVRKLKKTRRETDKGALYEDYSLLVHQFIAHLRRIHPSKPSVMAKVDGFDDRVEVKAADPLAVLPMPLYYIHSKMPMYNNKFFVFWDQVVAECFSRTIPWFTVRSQKALDRLFALEFER